MELLPMPKQLTKKKPNVVFGNLESPNQANNRFYGL
jgi:hypothetical protein